MAKIKLADYVIDFYSSIGVDKIFVVYGAANGDLIDAFTRNNKIQYVTTMHEQAAGFAAEGYAKIKPQSYKHLKRLAKILKEREDIFFEIRGHVCCTRYGRDAIDRKTKKRNLKKQKRKTKKAKKRVLKKQKRKTKKIKRIASKIKLKKTKFPKITKKKFKFLKVRKFDFNFKSLVKKIFSPIINIYFI